MLVYSTIGHTTAIIEAEASKIPAKIRMKLVVESSSVKKTIEARRKNVSIAMTMDTLSKVDIIPKKD